MITFIVILALMSLLIAVDSCDQADNSPGRTPRGLAATTGVAATILAGGCAAVPGHQQRLVSMPSMVFNDSGAFACRSGVNAQLEPACQGTG